MILEVEGLSHRYDTEPAVDDVTFGLEEGELLALLGPSGCGKTTIVQAIAGHLTPTAGRVLLRGTDVTDTPPERRDVGVVFQRSTLFPHMTVRENVAYGLEPQGIDPNRREEIVAEYLDLVELTEQRDSHPGELSGGQRRRAELARALAPEPDVLLLDEPLSALDRTLRTQLRGEIARIQDETGVTTLFVTHDQEEAMALADQLVILEGGQISSVGGARELYESPPNRFVASFLGRSNALSATLTARDPPTIALGEREIQVSDVPSDHVDETGTSADTSTDTEPIVHIRPEDVRLDAAEDVENSIELRGRVQTVTDAGNRYDVGVQLASGEEVIVEQRRDPPAVNDRVTIGIAEQDCTVLFGAAAEVEGEKIRSD